MYCEKENLGFIPWFPLGGGGSSLTKPGNPLEAEAKRRNATTAQLALAWLLQKSRVMLPIPGTSSIKHLEENMGATGIEISPSDWKQIEALAA
jgi:aryl-alcohol dehydrogenase-like predicted oxidoreductase